ncbi:TPA: hypothetical protein DDW69_02935 [candidate division CPR2 bacterium]|uniref:Guanylate kinase n=1 Tax=candidate division CPR2 bacterium GW2011_GWC1_41_48 TaxID=1618344 RepID=A0A0G0YHZ7_UNCC2|nr:MAG: Guanylate kinase [candidate division CPR2 bacterium GW2011_GWC2_39_35]KKR27640.1 MAG: Guanylate kinase [candidate division CPR2 bacterium GW2011_GWD1_39_7]KKR29200.1 MAG: Guanylate kinase [candidate division CPR2 bacterium GW2011_GWD2_39_7]KKS09156.1 MAG: Guanylate kinase [candidate division CPR2 bacterium GW2011_GWC1_41_48]OGB59457.1 MAG: hypothetical protein A2Y27_01140 [candidate division CPR2 bacterium GWD1_39_7]OGB70757.1 MAG: hypothetical protein A2Y26_02660 [candidate division C
MKNDNTNQLFALIGVTASGKTELAKHLCKKHGFFYIPSITTRPPRGDNETDYKHVTAEEFERYIKNSELLEYTHFAGNYYGKLKKDVEEHLEKGHSVYTITFDRVKELKGLINHVKIICIHPNDPIPETVGKRLKDRGHHEEEISRRIKTVYDELKLIDGLKEDGFIDYHITTKEDDYNHAIEEINKIAEKHK